MAFPSDVQADSGVHQQLTAMRQLLDRSIDAPSFARRFHQGRSVGLDCGERIGIDFERILLDVFYFLEDYAVDPSLRQEGEPQDDDVVSFVRGALDRLDALDTFRR